MRWLCIEVHFLDGRYHGRSEDGRDRQWPPNPHRLFQALVAAGNLGFRRTEFSDPKQDALRWLERRAAPEIVAAPACAAPLVRLYVPNNDMDKVARAWAQDKEPEKQPNELRTDKDLRPHRLEGDATVRFLWPIADDEWERAQPHAAVLCAEARHLHVLGLGIDLVAGHGRVLDQAARRTLPGETWVAEPGVGWRTPIDGSLDELFERHRAFGRRVQVGRGRGAERWVAPPSPPTVFQEVAYRRRAAGRRRPVHVFRLVDEDRTASFDPRTTIEIAARLRHAAHEGARGLKLDPEFVERFVCGHGDDVDSKNDRFSYVPLPTIPFGGRDGRIRRVLLAEPFGGGDTRARAVVRRLTGALLVAEDTGEVTAELRPLSTDERDADGVLARYCPPGGATQWGTATPMVLPGRDDFRSRKAHALVLKALAQAGYATPVAEIHLQREPVFPGGEPAGAYRVPAYLKALPRTHVVITFAEPVQGPLAIGAGRHVGLGLFAEVKDRVR
ncbi:type I-U CRISPR-associated protein Cas5/Cas6 [Rhodoplanes serenus]|uniref:Type I-U CRISPR-associated protein Cas5/Cas6 n=1 Tax=Rhodoplanes serenus TaxID=200615 RepID=A0A9X4XSI1_9BRAD|nr:type I-U CRISPR-associated protein Csb2 [Rhodoplanes serenus]MTW17846.1 type I-U CRISPR-associated protein Cas5/Cas6 [Rhodoplanes serenus]